MAPQSPEAHASLGGRSLSSRPYGGGGVQQPVPRCASATRPSAARRPRACLHACEGGASPRSPPPPPVPSRPGSLARLWGQRAPGTCLRRRGVRSADVVTFSGAGAGGGLNSEPWRAATRCRHRQALLAPCRAGAAQGSHFGGARVDACVAVWCVDSGPTSEPAVPEARFPPVCRRVVRASNTACPSRALTAHPGLAYALIHFPALTFACALTHPNQNAESGTHTPLSCVGRRPCRGCDWRQSVLAPPSSWCPAAHSCELGITTLAPGLGAAAARVTAVRPGCAACRRHCALSLPRCTPTCVPHPGRLNANPSGMQTASTHAFCPSASMAAEPL